MRRWAYAVAACGLGGWLSGCGDPCAEYAKRMDETCARNSSGHPDALQACKASVDQVVKAANREACRAAIDAMPK